MNTSFQNANGLKLFTVSNNKEDANVSVLMLHGYAEHIMRYTRFFEKMDDVGFRYMGFDLRGHGQSEGKKVMIKTFDDYVDDLHEVAKAFFKKGEKNFIFAHSVGGLTVIRYLEKYGDELITGVVTSGAAMKPDDSIPKILIQSAKYISKILPWLPTIKLDKNSISRDPEEIRKYDEDPLNYRGGTKAKFGHEMLEGMKLAKKELSKISVPIMVNHGAADTLIDPDSARWIYDGVSSQDKTLRMWEGLYHEITNEPEKEQVMNEMISWMTERSR